MSDNAKAVLIARAHAWIVRECALLTTGGYCVRCEEDAREIIARLIECLQPPSASEGGTTRDGGTCATS